MDKKLQSKTKDTKSPWNINSIILAIYVSIIWSSYLILRSFLDTVSLILGIVLVTMISLLGSRFLVEKIDKISIKHSSKSKDAKITAFLSFFIGTLLVMLVWYIAYFPGQFSPDSLVQYEQATSGNYSDWHPFWHTIVFFTIPYKLTGTKDIIVPLQMGYFSLLMGYLGLVIYKHSNLKMAIISAVYILINPYTGYILIYPWKDVGFAIAGCLAMLMTIEIYFSKSWANQWWRIVVLGIALANATLFRHNAILFTAVLIVALVLMLSRKQSLILLATFLLFVFIVKVPLFNYLDVEKPGQRVVETTGLPLTVFGNVIKEAPEKADQDMLDFAYSIATPEDWNIYYRCGDFNLVKMKCGDTTPVEDAGAIYMLKLLGKCFKYAPQESLKGLIALSHVVCGLDYNQDDTRYYLKPNNESVAEVLKGYDKLISNTLLVYIKTFGVALLVMVIFMAGKSNFRKFDDWKRLMICFSIFAYDFGTMLLLTGQDSRFFFITTLVAPLVVMLMLSERKEDQ